ncbi:MAG: hypothetical protein Q7J06_01355 [Bacteroidales bacterium]|nr:hypothetical protein [Bacteroidales bacterium]
MSSTVKLYTKDIHGYFINPDSYSFRRSSIEKTINSIGLASVTRIADNYGSLYKSNLMSHAHLMLIDRAIVDNHFPFLLLEDDATLMQKFPDYFNVPEKADLIYLGGSLCNYKGKKHDLFIKDYDPYYYRVYYMLSAHAILVPFLQGALIIKKACEKAIQNNDYNDIYLALVSNDHVFLTPKQGNYFYQEDNLTRQVTKFKWIDFPFKDLPCRFYPIGKNDCIRGE